MSRDQFTLEKRGKPREDVFRLMEMNLNPTPVRGSCTVLPGHITVNEKWRGTPLVHGLKGRIELNIVEKSGIVAWAIIRVMVLR